MSFLCRDNELRKMNQRYNSDEFECVVIYGRRRVGKTALINEFCKDKPAIFFSALNSNENDNLNSLSKAIGEYKEPGSISYPTYNSFDEIFDEITKLGLKQRLIFVIDEYPYLANSDNSISSRLQHLIDHKWQNSKLYLILCGSSMSFMQNQVLGYESPLYGRRTAQLKIEPLTYKDTAKFNFQLSCEENALVYGITGGIPHYINKLAVKKDLKSSLLDNLFDSSAYLFEEPGNLLKQELREPSTYNSIILAIASGASKLNEIATKVKLETSVCIKYINTLIELGLIKKEFPLGENTTRKTIYLIEDNFFRFWYRFVLPNISSISAERFSSLYDNLVKADLHDYMGIIFEKMCKDYLLYYANNLPFDISHIGQWWGTDSKLKKEVQIDIVATSIRNSNEYIIGSCKFKNEKIDVDELELLQHYAEVFGKGQKYYYYIFSLSGFTLSLEAKASDEVRLIKIEEMY